MYLQLRQIYQMQPHAFRERRPYVRNLSYVYSKRVKTIWNVI